MHHGNALRGEVGVYSGLDGPGLAVGVVTGGARV